MINQHEGNLLDLKEGILVHGCNCLGVMGSGIAKQIKDKWPVVYNSYKYESRTSGLFLGNMSVILGPGFSKIEQLDLVKHTHVYFDSTLPDRVIVVNALTQFDTASSENEVVVDYDAISVAFAKIKMIARDTKLPVHFPLIGCGLANGKWEEVGPRIEAALGEDVEKHLWIYKP
jgi:hypothetical protein